MGKRDFTQLISGFCVAGLTVMAAGAAVANCSDDTVSIRGAFGSAQFDVAVADTAQERAEGLMFVEQMGTMEGMLFVYERPQPVSFWMRNTLIPLDMIFVGADGVVDAIHENAIPLDETAIFGGEEIQFVLEINGGMAGRLGLAAGDEMRHPSFGPDAIWSCDEN